jgi:CheY-like chemotaxis protein
MAEENATQPIADRSGADPALEEEGDATGRTLEDATASVNAAAVSCSHGSEADDPAILDPDLAMTGVVSLAGTHVLLVDDEHDTREVVAAFLRRADARVSLAASAAEALDAIPTLRPDVLLSDIAMPGQDGYYLIDALRQLPVQQGGGTPAIALTAYAREEDRRRALDAGFHHHLSKPIVPHDLIAAIKRIASAELKLA